MITRVPGYPARPATPVAPVSTQAGIATIRKGL